MSIDSMNNLPIENVKETKKTYSKEVKSKDVKGGSKKFTYKYRT